MPVTFTFKRVGEEMPAHGQEIIWLRKTHNNGRIYFEQEIIVAHYQWSEMYVNESGKRIPTGFGVAYDPQTPRPTSDVFEYDLTLVFDEYFASPDHLWISTQDYYAALGE